MTQKFLIIVNYKKGSATAYLLLYVDYIILITFFCSVLKYIITILSIEFSIKDFGTLSYFLDIAINYNKTGLFLSQ